MANWRRSLPRPPRLSRLPRPDGPGAVAVALTALGVMGPDALGGLGPLSQPVLGADLLDDSPVLQVLAVFVLIATALGAATLAGTVRGLGRSPTRGVVAAALATVAAQPLLAGLNEPLGIGGIGGADDAGQGVPTPVWAAGGCRRCWSSRC